MYSTFPKETGIVLSTKMDPTNA
jgi:hypothetical protein